MTIRSDHDKNVSWLIAHYDELLKRFPDQYIAVYDEEVLATAKTLDALSKRIETEATIVPKFDIRAVVTRKISTAPELYL